MDRFSGQRLRDLRTAAGIPIERLALDVHRSAQTIYHYESGRTDPPASIVAALARALDTHPGDLFVAELAA